MANRGQDYSFGPRTLCTFRSEGTRAKAVALMGPFNGWSTTANLMHDENGRWEARVMLPPGRQEYCFFVLEESIDSIGGLRGTVIRAGSVIDVVCTGKEMVPVPSEEMIGAELD